MVTLDRTELCNTALADWREFRNTIRGDENEISRVYAEMTGWMASRDPIALSEFVKMQRDRAEHVARSLRETCPNCDSDNVCEQTGEDNDPMACLDCAHTWDPDA